MTVHLMIPARFASTRLPGKILLPLKGKPMLQHVYERAVESQAGEVSILVDDPQVEKVARGFCDNVYMTSPDCLSGTERIINLIQLLDLPPSDIIVNIQGDEPFIEPAKIRQVSDLLLADDEIPMSTLAHVIDDPHDLNNPNVVKVVLDEVHHALYFSRSLIPYSENPQPKDYLRHIGVYAYRVDFLNELHLLAPSPLQLKEKLEQLTVLYHGYQIKVGICDKPTFIDINTREDYERVISMLNSGE
jgi:3-deoxy-manno-octulosonate cytidylyltransferase (CMP-KDO synthetase)